jgi:hypothetical protein
MGRRLTVADGRNFVFPSTNVEVECWLLCMCSQTSWQFSPVRLNAIAEEHYTACLFYISFICKEKVYISWDFRFSQLGCCAELNGRSLPTFQSCLQRPPSANFYQTTRRNIPEHSQLQSLLNLWWTEKGKKRYKKEEKSKEWNIKMKEERRGENKTNYKRNKNKHTQHCVPFYKFPFLPSQCLLIHRTFLMELCYEKPAKQKLSADPF